MKIYRDINYVRGAVFFILNIELINQRLTFELSTYTLNDCRNSPPHGKLPLTENSPGKFPPGKFSLRKVPLPRKSLEMYQNPLIHLSGLFYPSLVFSVATLFRLVARCARVRIEDSSRNRFASTAYFARPDYVASMHAYTTITTNPKP